MFLCTCAFFFFLFSGCSQFSLYLFLSNLIPVFLSFFNIYSAGVHFASWICSFIVSSNFGHHFCKYFSVPLFFYSRTLIICMLDILVLFCKSFMLCFIIFSYFSLCASFNYFLILCLQVHYLFFLSDQSANSTQCIFLFQKLYFTFL